MCNSIFRNNSCAHTRESLYSFCPVEPIESGFELEEICDAYNNIFLNSFKLWFVSFKKSLIYENNRKKTTPNLFRIVLFQHNYHTSTYSLFSQHL